MASRDIEFKVIIVDDDPVALKAAESIVKSLDLTPICTTDPTQVKGLVEANINNILLILSDYKMPELDGYQLRKTLLKEYKDVPFIIMSSHIDEDMALKALELKVAAFMEKPLKKENIQTLIYKETKDRRDTLTEDREFICDFVEEATDHLEEIEPLILSLEDNPDDVEGLNRIYALIHTIKGTSGFFKPDTLHKFAHIFENFLERAKSGQLVLDEESITVLLESFDIIRKLVKALSDQTTGDYNLEELIEIFANYSDTSTTKGKRPNSSDKNKENKIQTKAPEKKLEEIRVPAKTLDEFMELSGEVTVTRNMINKIFKSLEKHLDGSKEVVQLGTLLEVLHKVNVSMQEKVIDLRKVSLKNVFRPLPRAMRDLCTSLKKNINLVIVGDELRVDTKIAEALSNSLIHMVRNCADHAIEEREERSTTGKDATGSIELFCVEIDEKIVITLADDGRGIDPKKIKQIALKKGLYTAEALEQMPKNRVFDIIFESGFSTAAKVTNVSGRGVGMDMVKKSIDAVDGTLDIDSVIGKGTTFKLSIPVPKSVLIISSLLIEVQSRIFAIPQENIIRLLSLENRQIAEMIIPLQGTTAFKLDGLLYPLINLSELFKYPQDNNFDIFNEPQIHILVVATKNVSYALLVDEIIDFEDTVVKPLSSGLRNLSIFSGATFLGDGTVGLILDIEGIGKTAKITSNYHAEKEIQIDVASQLSSLKNDEAQKKNWANSNYLLFDLNAKGIFGAQLRNIFRLEEINIEQIKYSGNQKIFIYRNRVTPIFDLGCLLNLSETSSLLDRPRIPVLMLKDGENFIALAVKTMRDFVQNDTPVDCELQDRAGLLGGLVFNDQTISIVDLDYWANLGNIAKIWLAPAHEEAPLRSA